jgi:hypothetical protein
VALQKIARESTEVTGKSAGREFGSGVKLNRRQQGKNRSGVMVGQALNRIGGNGSKIGRIRSVIG